MCCSVYCSTGFYHTKPAAVIFYFRVCHLQVKEEAKHYCPKSQKLGQRSPIPTYFNSYSARQKEPVTHSYLNRWPEGVVQYRKQQRTHCWKCPSALSVKGWVSPLLYSPPWAEFPSLSWDLNWQPFVHKLVSVSNSSPPPLGLPVTSLVYQKGHLVKAREPWEHRLFVWLDNWSVICCTVS